MKWRSLEESTPGVDARPLREIFAERKALIAQYVPQETQAMHEQVIAELREQGISRQAPAAGAKAPRFELKDHNGKAVPSAEFLKTGRLIICFFRGRWCPFCVGQLEAMNRIRRGFEPLAPSWLPSRRKACSSLSSWPTSTS
jgi:AhpC/TSA family